MIEAQLAQYWDLQATTSPRLSLLKTVPEQPWNRQLGFNIEGHGIYVPSPSPVVAGGGVVSSCAVEVAGTGGELVPVIPIPTWQIGFSAPENKVRTVPDISLAASDGRNYSYYPICAQPEDCSGSTTGGTVKISPSGGTSAAAPAFAGIMALVDQAAGDRQGQADYTLYRMAKEYPKVFNDVTIGSNDVPCDKERQTAHSAAWQVIVPMGSTLWGNTPLGMDTMKPPAWAQ